MLELLLLMLERLGIIVMLAFVATRLHFFRDMISSSKLSKKQQLIAIIFFAGFGIIGTYSGFTFRPEAFELERFMVNLAENEAVANFRVIGIVLAGLFGGYKVGIGAGLVAGIHRISLGGFTAFSCGIATIFAGWMAAHYAKKNPDASSKPTHIFFLGALAETIQMGLIILLAKPTSLAIALVQMIGLPMIIANGLGCFLFLLIIRNVLKEEHKAGALQAQKSLRIAEQTLAFFKQGLTIESSTEVCTIVYKELNVAAVAITNKQNILAHIGLASDHHQAGALIQTQITRRAIQKKEIMIANDKTIHCNYKDCPLGAAVIAPLVIGSEVVGTLKFYFHSEVEVTSLEREMLAGLTNLLSSQLELAEAERAYQLAKEAEINALQAQINPNFLFNTLNTVISLVRIDQNKARKMLHSLAQFLRQNMSVTTTSLHTLEEELNHTKAYLSIEEIRFEDRFFITYEVDPACLKTRIPPLTLQPIVENAVKYGFENKRGDCRLTISVKDLPDSVHLSVMDNGAGIDEEQLPWLGTKIAPSSRGTGIALFNINKRLQMLFGEKASIQVNSELGKGTTISFEIPKKGIEKRI